MAFLFKFHSLYILPSLKTFRPEKFGISCQHIPNKKEYFLITPISIIQGAVHMSHLFVMEHLGGIMHVTVLMCTS